MVINEIERLLTTREVASMLHVHTNTLRRWSDNGTVKSLRVNERGDRRYRRQDIKNFLDEYQSHKQK
jgi:excisionase family DNA binding protein